MSSKKVFPIIFFSALIAILDISVYSLLGTFAEYNVAISLFVTNIIFVFLGVKVGCNGAVIGNVLIRALLYLMISPYPWHFFVTAFAGGILGEIVLFFVKRKRAFFPNVIIYFLFNLIYALRDFISFENGLIFQMNQDVYITYGAIAGSFVLSYMTARLILMPKLKTAGIEK